MIAKRTRTFARRTRKSFIRTTPETIKEQEMKKVAVCLICTGKYDVFLEQILKSIDDKFLLSHQISIHIFSDKVQDIVIKDFINMLALNRVEIYYHSIESLKFPLITLYRYRIMLENIRGLAENDYIYYMDVDMRIENEVGDDILGPLVAVKHPGFSVVGGGAWCTDENSTAYTGPMHRNVYVAGGVQGGETKHFLEAMRVMDDNIRIDESRGVMAPWHDESHWNKYIAYYKGDLRILDSSYCMVENMPQRQLWKLTHLTPKIIALDKIHSEIRS